MTLYLGKWKIMDSARVNCMTYFASMTPEDDVAESPNVDLLGRWSDVGNASGSFVCRAKNYSDVASWLYNWVPMANIDIWPICDDNTARKIILNKAGSEPAYQVDYSHVSDEPLDDENLYKITYKFFSDKKVTGNEVFANLLEEADKADAGNCRPLGRWHNLGNGSGMAIAAAKSEEDIYAWAFNWAGMCDCEIVPVLTDVQSRKIISSKPDFEQKLLKVKSSMEPPKVAIGCM
tara:strand:+ start:8491 stop:9192 length:702 start_codon:yes stop_codon:yes gene_type:complete